MNNPFSDIYHKTLNDPDSHNNRGNLSLREYASIKSYVSYSYDLGYYLRTASESKDLVFDSATRALKSCIRKLPLDNCRITLYRGTRLPNSFFNEMIQSGCYCDKAFVSFSDSECNAMRHLRMDGHQNSWDEYQRVLFMLERHTNGGDISIYSGIPEIDGTEILFPPNTKFIVQKKDIIEIPFDDNTKKAIHRIMIIQKKHS